MEKIIIYEELTNFSYSDITKMEFLDRGTYGFVYKLIIKDTEVRYALKKMDLIIGEKYYNEKENEIKGEIKILHLISTNIKKPKAIPKFYGYFIIKDQQINQISYCLVFELKEGSLRGLIEERRKSNQKFTLDELHTTMRWLVNIMSYLQLNLITHRDLKPGNILYSDLVENQGKIQYKSLTLIDFGGSKCLLHYNNSGFDDNTLILTKRYCSPELMFFSVIEKKEKANFNPFKSDVFSMGLLILEMGTLQLPFENRKALNPKEYFEELEKENVRLLEFLVFCYDKFAKKSNDNREKLNEIRNILKKSLTYKFEKRPDFLELFFELNKIEKKDQNNKEIILQKVIEQDKKFFHGFNMDEEKIFYDKESLQEDKNFILKSTVPFLINEMKFLDILKDLKVASNLNFINIETIRDGFFEKEMKEIYHRLKEMKFLQIIKSFRVRAIPHPKRKAALLYSHWIFNLFYEEIYLDTLQSPKQHEIKLTHFHDLNWVDGILSEDAQVILAILYNNSIKWKLEKLEIVLDSRSHIDDKCCEYLLKPISNIPFSDIQSLKLAFCGDMIEKEESVPNLLTAFSKNFEIHKNQNLKLFSFLLFFKQDSDKCLNAIEGLLKNQTLIETFNIFLWYISSEASFSTFTKTLQRISSTLINLSIGFQSTGQLSDSTLKNLISTIKINGRRFAKFSIYISCKSLMIETCNEIYNFVEIINLSQFDIYLKCLENSEQQKTWKAKLEHLLKFKSPSLKTNYLKINFSIN